MKPTSSRIIPDLSLKATALFITFLFTMTTFSAGQLGSLPPDPDEVEDDIGEALVTLEKAIRVNDTVNGTLPTFTSMEMDILSAALGEKLDAYKAALASGAIEQVPMDEIALEDIGIQGSSYLPNRTLSTQLPDLVELISTLIPTPFACISSGSDMGTLATSFSFDSGCSHDSETAARDLLTRWDWTTDGTWDTAWSMPQAVSHTFSATGTKLVTLQVKDEDGLLSTATTTVRVSAPPSPCFTAPSSVEKGKSGTFDASCSTDDYTSAGSLQVRWDWTNDGSWDTSWTTAKTASHPFQTTGTNYVKLQVKDDTALTAATTKTVTVTSPPSGGGGGGGGGGGSGGTSDGQDPGSKADVKPDTGGTGGVQTSSSSSSSPTDSVTQEAQAIPLVGEYLARSDLGQSPILFRRTPEGGYEQPDSNEVWYVEGEELWLTPSGPVVELIADTAWLDNELGTYGSPAQFHVKHINDTQYVSLTDPAILTGVSVAFEAVTIAQSTHYTLGHEDMVELGERGMQIAFVQYPGWTTETYSNNNTNASQADEWHGRLAIDFSGMDVTGQEIRFNKEWLTNLGFQTPVFTHEDGTTIPQGETTSHIIVQAPHFSTIFVDDFNDNYLNTGEWTVVNNGYSVQEKNGRLELTVREQYETSAIVKSDSHSRSFTNTDGIDVSLDLARRVSGSGWVADTSVSIHRSDDANKWVKITLSPWNSHARLQDSSGQSTTWSTGEGSSSQGFHDLRIVLTGNSYTGHLDSFSTTKSSSIFSGASGFYIQFQDSTGGSSSGYTETSARDNLVVSTYTTSSGGSGTGTDFTDDFDDGSIDNTKWSIIGGSENSNCGSSTSPNGLQFDGSSTRSATTSAIDTSGSSPYIQFDLIIGTGSNPCENADSGEDVLLQYSTDGGSSWTTWKTYGADNYGSWTNVIHYLPSAAETSSTYFRWIQPTHSGSSFDNWAIDDVHIKGPLAGGSSPSNTAPTACFTVSPSSGYSYTTRNFDASCSSDSETSNSNLKVRWDWTNNGAYDTGWTTTKTAQQTSAYGNPGTYTAKVQVEDGGGLRGTYTRTVTVYNSPPVACTDVSPSSGTTGTTFQFDASCSSDAESSDSQMTYRWDWTNDGTYDTSYSSSWNANHMFGSSGTYTVKVQVRDAHGSTDTDTISVSVSQEQSQGSELFNNFENGLGSGWSATGLWHQSSRQEADGSFSARYGRSCCDDFDTGSRTYGSLTSPLFTVPTQAPTLVYQSWFEDEGGSYYDQKFVEISDDGGQTWDLIEQVNGPNNPENMNTWHLKSHDLSSYKGKDVKIRFYFDSRDSLYNDYEGWYVDGIVIQTAGAEVIHAGEWYESSIQGPTQGYSSYHYDSSSNNYEIGYNVNGPEDYVSVDFDVPNGGQEGYANLWIFAKSSGCSGTSYTHGLYVNENLVKTFNPCSMWQNGDSSWQTLKISLTLLNEGRNSFKIQGRCSSCSEQVTLWSDLDRPGYWSEIVLNGQSYDGGQYDGEPFFFLYTSGQTVYETLERYTTVEIRDENGDWSEDSIQEVFTFKDPEKLDTEYYSQRDQDGGGRFTTSSSLKWMGRDTYRERNELSGWDYKVFNSADIHASNEGEESPQEYGYYDFYINEWSSKRAYPDGSVVKDGDKFIQLVESDPYSSGDGGTSRNPPVAGHDSDSDNSWKWRIDLDYWAKSCETVNHAHSFGIGGGNGGSHSHDCFRIALHLMDMDERLKSLSEAVGFYAGLEGAFEDIVRDAGTEGWAKKMLKISMGGPTVSWVFSMAQTGDIASINLNEFDRNSRTTGRQIPWTVFSMVPPIVGWKLPVDPQVPGHFLPWNGQTLFDSSKSCTDTTYSCKT